MKICQHKAIGKPITTVWIHFAKNSTSTPLNNIVATKLIIGHMQQTVITEIANMITIGLSFLESTSLKASFLANGPPI